MLSTEERRGFWREPDGVPTSRSIAFEAWALAAHEILTETAGTYHGLIHYGDLAEAVQDRTDIRTSQQQRNWIGTVLLPVVHLCHRNGEPPLTSLVVRKQDGLVGEGYDEVLRVSGLRPIEDATAREKHAAGSRLACYQWAGSAPPDGGTAQLAPRAVAKASATRRVAKTDKPTAVCPTCFIALPATGECDNCA